MPGKFRELAENLVTQAMINENEVDENHPAYVKWKSDNSKSNRYGSPKFQHGTENASIGSHAITTVYHAGPDGHEKSSVFHHDTKIVDHEPSEISRPAGATAPGMSQKDTEKFYSRVHGKPGDEQEPRPGFPPGTTYR